MSKNGYAFKLSQDICFVSVLTWMQKHLPTPYKDEVAKMTNMMGNFNRICRVFENEKRILIFRIIFVI